VLKLRATTSTGAVVYDPQRAELTALVHEVASAGKDAFLILERRADPTGQTYLQMLAQRGRFVLEYRDGARRQHLQAVTLDGEVVADAFCAWAAGAGWRAVLDWHPTGPRTWWQPAAVAAGA
jgi:hypothetical protein